MRSDLVFALIVGVVFIVLVALSRWWCRSAKATPVISKPPRAKRDPKPFAAPLASPSAQ